MAPDPVPLPPAPTPLRLAPLREDEVPAWLERQLVAWQQRCPGLALDRLARLRQRLQHQAACVRTIEWAGRRAGFVLLRPQADHWALSPLDLNPGPDQATVSAAVLSHLAAQAQGVPLRIQRPRGPDF